jgi:hypothetical protein
MDLFIVVLAVVGGAVMGVSDDDDDEMDGSTREGEVEVMVDETKVLLEVSEGENMMGDMVGE